MQRVIKGSINNRNEGLDLLRVILCIAVIISHTCSYLTNIKEYHSLTWIGCVSISSINMIAVPCFFILSGYFLLNDEKKINIKDFYLNSLKKIVVPFFIWSFIYCLYNLRIWNISNIFNNFDLNTIIQTIIDGPPHLWFLFYLMSFYIMLPFFRYLCKNKELFFLYFTIVIFFKFLLPYFQFIPYLSNISNLGEKLGISNYLGYSIYFLSGYIFHKYKDYYKFKKNITILVFVTSILIIPILTVISSYVIQEKNYVFQNYLSISILISSLIFFYWFYDKSILKNILLKKVSFLSKYTFEAYLSHILIINIGIILGIYNLNIPSYLQLVIHIFFSIGLTFLLSAFIIKIKNYLRS